jgi:hypothetical protein
VVLENEGEFVAAKGAVLVSEADAGVELGVAGEAAAAAVERNGALAHGMSSLWRQHVRFYALEACARNESSLSQARISRRVRARWSNVWSSGVRLLAGSGSGLVRRAGLQDGSRPRWTTETFLGALPGPPTWPGRRR